MEPCAEKPEALMRLAWNHHLYTGFEPATLQILRSGSANPIEGGVDQVDAALEWKGTQVVGSVAFHAHASDWRVHLHHVDPQYDSCVLHVVLEEDAVICRMDGTVIPTVVMRLPEGLMDRYNELLERGTQGSCGRTLAAMKPIEQDHLITNLAVERMERKYHDFLERYRAAGNDWNEAFYVTLFRAMGRGVHQRPYEQLAHTVRYAQICRVRESLPSVEALLLGSAGLLEVEFQDGYTRQLREEFAHLRRRFEIVPMYPSAWRREMTGPQRPTNFTTIRLAQLAALLASKEFLFSRVLRCKTLEELHTLFSVTASEYWCTHYGLGSQSRYGTKSFGETMLDNLLINVVSPTLFAYGTTTGDPDLCDRALEMLEELPAEENRFVQRWRSAGVEVDSAFFSQGVLQLSRAYCEPHRCAECPVGRLELCAVAH
ncbi:MAG: DUF2851 family protein [Alistipes sp.]|nr:DUF2851 family protein [Alistipes sp.]